MTRGERNKNPLNIRKSGETFVGEVKNGYDSQFKVFEDMMYGYRAAFVILGTYNMRGLNTIDKIVTAWAPPHENDTERYIRDVESWSGVDRRKKLSLIGNSGDYIKIVKAMSVKEIGKCFDDAVEKGFKLQTKIK